MLTFFWLDSLNCSVYDLFYLKCNTSAKLLLYVPLQRLWRDNLTNTWGFLTYPNERVEIWFCEEDLNLLSSVSNDFYNFCLNANNSFLKISMYVTRAPITIDLFQNQGWYNSSRTQMTASDKNLAWKKIQQKTMDDCQSGNIKAIANEYKG